jgi:tropinone reductase I
MFTLPLNATYCVTGGTSGIGLEIARLLLQSSPPCRVLIVARRSKELEMTVAMLAQECEDPDRILGAAADVSTPSGRSAVSSAVNAAFDGVLTGLINNVGCNVRKQALEQTEGEYDAMVQTNMSSTYFLSKLLSPYLFKQAKEDVSNGSVVVNVSSMAGVYSSGTGAVYGMTKAAVNSLTRSLACEWSKFGVRVNCVAPWMTVTPMLEEAVKKDPSALDKVKEWTPMGRLALPEEAAGPVVFLCTKASGFMTGTVLNVDGGLGAQGFDGPCC